MVERRSAAEPGAGTGGSSLTSVGAGCAAVVGPADVDGALAAGAFDGRLDDVELDVFAWIEHPAMLTATTTVANAEVRRRADGGIRDPVPWTAEGTHSAGVGEGTSARRRIVGNNHCVRDRVKAWVVGTPLEAPARSVARRLRPPAPLSPAQQLNRAYDEQTAKVISRVLRHDSNCIDVGCHEGVILDQMLRCAPDGSHLAFEPLPDLAAGLREKYLGDGRVTVHEMALGDEQGHTTFCHVVTNPGYSGLRRRHYDREGEQVVEIEVDVARLDDLVPDDRAIDLVKIDVEGAELGVLLGGKRLLARCRPHVVFEHGLGGADCYGTRPEQVFDLLGDCGLSISLMADWLGDGAVLARDQFVDEFDSARNYYFLAHPA
jgi:FkbM family methyltransferase